MKKLEELGISQSPWRCICYNYKKNDKYDHLGEVRFADNQILCCDIRQPDAMIVAASPKLYKALYELVEAYEACNAHDGTCENCERRKMCQQDEERIIANAKSALAEAAGERGEDK